MKKSRGWHGAGLQVLALYWDMKCQTQSVVGRSKPHAIFFWFNQDARHCIDGISARHRRIQRCHIRRSTCQFPERINKCLLFNSEFHNLNLLLLVLAKVVENPDNYRRIN